MNILKDIPWEYPIESFLDEACLSRGSELSGEGRRFAEAVFPLVRPKAVYTDVRADCSDEVLTLNGVSFPGSVLNVLFKDCGRVFPFVVTCGDELESLPLSDFDSLAYYWLDMIKGAVMVQAEEYLRGYVEEKTGKRPLYAINPGSGGDSYWSLRQQKELFMLFPDIRGAIGVTLTDECVMVPNKTTSGIYFTSAVPYTTCSFCTAQFCRDRLNPPAQIS
ncbi:vitamin B12 dependent-methionine synthase activation domain-containing protein [Breznakiella homolactica]|uniref:Vitamin B12 dependent methionine synthase n=1 Tax=Breznakiella homolactica TaxID=2798577 RepID=A0A7T7XNU8_9SPIR|nr:vitamin B12 dependent-methionine synthase activation domain-containing protein [Breznakiella homolactica]QQO09779.1 hypothetical protein JFL75_02385 [Breznakiella homolactica]